MFTSTKCPHCGVGADASAEFCASCGKQMNYTQTPSVSQFQTGSGQNFSAFGNLDVQQNAQTEGNSEMTAQNNYPNTFINQQSPVTPAGNYSQSNSFNSVQNGFQRDSSYDAPTPSLGTASTAKSSFLTPIIVGAVMLAAAAVAVGLFVINKGSGEKSYENYMEAERAFLTDHFEEAESIENMDFAFDYELSVIPGEIFNSLGAENMEEFALSGSANKSGDEYSVDLMLDGIKGMISGNEKEIFMALPEISDKFIKFDLTKYLEKYALEFPDESLVWSDLEPSYNNIVDKYLEMVSDVVPEDDADVTINGETVSAQKYVFNYDVEFLEELIIFAAEELAQNEKFMDSMESRGWDASEIQDFIDDLKSGESDGNFDGNYQMTSYFKDGKIIAREFDITTSGESGLLELNYYNYAEEGVYTELSLEFSDSTDYVNISFVNESSDGKNGKISVDMDGNFNNMSDDSPFFSNDASYNITLEYEDFSYDETGLNGSFTLSVMDIFKLDFDAEYSGRVQTVNGNASYLAQNIFEFSAKISYKTPDSVSFPSGDSVIDSEDEEALKSYGEEIAAWFEEHADELAEGSVFGSLFESLVPSDDDYSDILDDIYGGEL